MPIQNIQGLVDKNGLSYISNFTRDYYEEGLANLGQRNTNDSLLTNETFTIGEVFSDLNKYLSDDDQNNLYYYVIYHFDDLNGSSFYTLNKSNIDREFDITNNKPLSIEDIQDIIASIQELSNLSNSQYIKKLNIKNNNINNTDNNYLILNKKLNIISELFDFITSNQNFISKNNLYIPIDYQFGYIANGINKQTIYHSFKDVYVNVGPEEFNSNDDDFNLESLNFYLDNIFYFAPQKYIKTDIYGYIFSNEGDEETIKYHKKFTLPYVYQINEGNEGIADNEEEQYDNCWVINDIKTKIQAKSHDAVNLNIILAHYYKNGNAVIYNFLSGLNNNNFDVNRINYQNKNEAVKFNIKNGSDVIPCEIQTPIIKTFDLTKEDIKLNTVLQNSTLIIISKISDIALTGKNLERYGNGYVTTMWHYVSIDKKTGYFDYISIEDNVALDFNQLTNFDNLLKYEIQHVKQVEPDNFLHTHLIFDQIYQQLKQETNKPIYSYPVLQNIKGSQYNNKYANNMNFSLKYINYISGEIGVDIKGVSKSSDTKYLKNSNNISNSSNTVTNALYQYIINNKVNYYNEYIPNYNVPVFDLSEILVKDSNVINKQNIITFNYDGSMYYSYIGTSQNTNKNILTIGSSNIDINLGENTLIDYNTKTKFNIQDTINIDFNTINANGKLIVKNDLEVGGNILLNKFEWTESTINNIKILSTSFIPQFKYYSFNNNGTYNIYALLYLNNLEQNIRNLSNLASSSGLAYGSDSAKNYLYINPILVVPHSLENDMTYYYKYNDLLVLPNLVNYLGLTSDDVKYFDSNTNDIIYVNNIPLYLVSSNNILGDYLKIVSSTDTGITIDTENVQNFYLGNTLYVTYIEKDKKLIVNEAQSNKIKSIWKIPTNIN